MSTDDPATEEGCLMELSLMSELPFRNTAHISSDSVLSESEATQPAEVPDVADAPVFPATPVSVTSAGFAILDPAGECLAWAECPVDAKQSLDGHPMGDRVVRCSDGELIFYSTREKRTAMARARRGVAA